MTPNQKVRQLSKRFGIRVNKMEIVQKGVYRIATSDGREFCLKRMSYPPVQLRWIDSTLQRMRRKGFDRLGWRNPSVSSGKRLFVRRFRGSPPFVLIPWLRGPWPSPASSKQMKACGALLARFHQTGNNIQIPVSGRRNRKGSWPAVLKKERNKLRSMIRKAGRGGFNSPLDWMLQDHGKELVQMADASLRALRRSGYKRVCRKTRAVLCHGDGGPTNFIRTGRGMYLIDFETLRMDLRAYDLYRIIFNSCKENHWKFSTAQSLLDGYQTIYRLNRSDIAMLKALLRFPRGICKLIGQYDFKISKGKRQIERDFPIVLAHERKRSAFLKQLDMYAGIG